MGTHTSFTVETVLETDTEGRARSAVVSDVSAGTATVSGTYDTVLLWTTLADAGTGSSSVLHLWADASALVVTDIEYPDPDDTEETPRLTALDGVHRELSVIPHGDAVHCLCDRRLTLDAFEELASSGPITVYLESDRPIVFEDGTGAAAVIAPRVPVETQR
jgi:hypothetical protein